MTRRLMIVGASGLVGQATLRRALGDERIARVVAPTRRALPEHPKLENPLVDFARLPQQADWWDVDAVVCALGTTMRAAGSRAAFRAVDYEYPLMVAGLVRRRGARAFALTSSTGASPGARFFYSRVKGEIERAITACGFESLTIVRPSLLGGRRASSRPLEALGLAALGTLGSLIPRRYRISPAECVAAALLDGALDAPRGITIVESGAIRERHERGEC